MRPDGRRFVPPIDRTETIPDNRLMENAMKTFEPTVDQAEADLEEVCPLLSEGRRVDDPELSRRIAERADEARADALRSLGVREVAVGIVRETRADRINTFRSIRLSDVGQYDCQFHECRTESRERGRPRLLIMCAGKSN